MAPKEAVFLGVLQEEVSQRIGASGAALDLLVSRLRPPPSFGHDQKDKWGNGFCPNGDCLTHFAELGNDSTVVLLWLSAC